nr:serine hydrolase domain-containing protein [Sphingomicrobium aestuariivivum]
MAALLPLALVACAPSVAEVAPEPAPPLLEEGADPLTAVIEQYGFEGEVALSRGPAADDYSYRGGPAEAVWPWASVTKQVVAIIVMQEVEAGRLSLDAPVSDYVDWAGEGPAAPSLRQLLRHQSGLFDPEDQPGFDGDTGFPLDLDDCIARRGAPGGDFDYSNCDTLLVARVLEAVTQHDLGALYRERIGMPLGLTSSGLVTATTPLAPSAGGTTAERIAAYGAAGALAGPTSDLIAIDEGLMAGALLGADALATLWQGDPAVGYSALGQWEFTAPLAGCEAPVRIVERRGAIGSYQARNYILPEQGLALVAFTGLGEDMFGFGEIWTGSGFSHDLLAAAACGA